MGETGKDSGLSLWKEGRCPRTAFRKDLRHRAVNSVPWSPEGGGWPSTCALRTPGDTVLAPRGLSLGSIRRKDITVFVEGT